MWNKGQNLLLNLVLECSKKKGKTENNETIESGQEPGVTVKFLKTNKWKTKQYPDNLWFAQPAIFHNNLSHLSLIRVLMEDQGSWKLFVIQYKCAHVKCAIPLAPLCTVWATPLNETVRFKVIAAVYQQ